MDISIVQADKYSQVIKHLSEEGAYNLPQSLGLAEVLEIINKLLLKKDRALEMLGYDILSLLYKSIAVGSTKYTWLQSLIAIVEDDEVKERWEQVIGQVLPEHPADIRLMGMKEEWGPYISGFLWSDEESVTKSMRLSSRLISSVLEELVDNYEGNAQVYYRLSNKDIWLQESIRNKTLLYIKGRTYSVFEELKSLIILERMGANDKSDLYVWVSINALKYLINRKGLVVNLSSNKAYVNEEYIRKVFPLSTFSYESESLVQWKREVRLGILCYGIPGSGKTSWAYSFYEEVLRKEGFLLLVVSYKEYLDLYLGVDVKACVLVNDADHIETEENRAQVLSKLESTNGFSHIVTIFTVNSEDNFDEALMRKGRFDYHLIFNKSMI